MKEINEFRAKMPENLQSEFDTLVNLIKEQGKIELREALNPKAEPVKPYEREQPDDFQFNIFGHNIL